MVEHYLQMLEYYFKPFYPVIAAGFVGLLLKFIFSKNWARLILKIIFLTLIFSYLFYSIWDTITCLNLSDWISAILNLFLYFVKALILLTIILSSLVSTWTTARYRSIESE